jgi:DNA-binding transcriptional LysR family regulator
MEDAGIAVSSCMLAQQSINDGKLKRVLPEWNAGGYSIYAAYPSRRYLSAKVRLFLDMLTEVMHERINAYTVGAQPASASMQPLARAA